MKNILFVIGSMSKGGAERVVSIMSDHYAGKGWSTSIMMLLNNRVEYEINPDVKLINLACTAAKGKFDAFRLIKEIRKYIKSSNPDVVVAFMGPIALTTWMACKGLNKRLIVSERIDPAKAHRNFIVKKLLNKVYAKSDCTVLQTKRAWSYFPRAVQKNSIIIGNPVKVQCVAAENYEHRIVTAGRLTDQKNHRMLIEAFDKVRKNHPEYTLDIYGEGPLRNELQALIDEKGISNCVTLVGNVTDLHKRMSTAEMFVLSSDYEGLSNALLEAMMMGLPCISTDCAGSDEVIKDGENGLLVPVGNGEKLAEAMLLLIESETCRNQLAEAAKMSVDKYKVENVIQQWTEVVEG